MNEEAAVTHALRWLYQRFPGLRGAIDVEAAQELGGAWAVALSCATLPAPVRLRIYPSGIVRELPPSA